MQTPAHDVAIFLDTDNLIIAAQEARVLFDINIVLDHIKELTGGRIVLRRAYGEWRPNTEMPRQVAAAGFELQSSVRLNQMSKNVADMQLTVDAIETLIDGYSFSTYVLMTGDRDFMPLVQALRKRGKHVVGVGVRHATSDSLAELCDQYIYYDDLAKVQRQIDEKQIRAWLKKATERLWLESPRIRASVLRREIDEVSDGAFGGSKQAKGSFSKLLEGYSDLVALQREGSSLFVIRPKEDQPDLHLTYRSSLKKLGLRVVPAEARLRVLRDAIAYLEHHEGARWQQVVTFLSEFYQEGADPISKSKINDVLRVARRAEVIGVKSSSSKPLSTLPVTLLLEGRNVFKPAAIRCDAAYIRQIKQLDDVPFEMEEVALALYDTPQYTSYVRYVHDRFCADDDGG